MTKFFSLIFLIGLIGCTATGSRDTTSSDSISDEAVMDSLPPVDAEEEFQSDIEDETGNADVKARYEKLTQEIIDNANSYYLVGIQTSEYEAGSEVAWYFDQSFSPLYFREIWSMEGTEGVTEYLVHSGVVTCALVEEVFGSGTSNTQWCSTTGGQKISFDDASGESTTEELAPGFQAQCNQDLEVQVNTLKGLLREGKIIDEGEDTYTLRLENTIDVGEEVTEYTEINIPKKLYAELKP